MRSVAARLERLERALVGGCGACGGRVLIVSSREGEPEPVVRRCACGQERVLRWVSQTPASLDAALEQAAERSDDDSFPLPKAGP